MDKEIEYHIKKQDEILESFFEIYKSYPQYIVILSSMF